MAAYHTPSRFLACIMTLALLAGAVAPISLAAPPPVPSAALAPTGFSCDNVTEIPKAECEALVAVYNSTSGPGWTDNAGWLQSNTPCSWSRVTCLYSEPQLPFHVGSLSLDGNQLEGTIPPEVGYLTHLEHLNFSKNKMSGPIPAAIGNLKKLRVFSAGSPRWPALGHSGEILDILATLPLLENIYLSGNQLTGSIPPELANLTNLEV